MALHGVAYCEDPAVQAFARHLDGPDTAGVMVAGMRAFLEDKPQLAPPAPWSPSRPPVTGYRAVAELAVAAGLTSARIDAARRAARLDLAGTAWILDPADGLPELLELVAGRAELVLVADPADPATDPVVDALELAGRYPVVDPDRLPPALTGGRALLIDADWSPVLAAASGRAGEATTALIDRFGSGTGTPDLRAADLPGLLLGVADWLDRVPRAEGDA